MRNSGEDAAGMGLCVNCDDRLICKLHQAGQQVIFCEEYKLSSGENERQVQQRQVFAAPIDFGIEL